jgi:hypothetical protein
MNSHSAIEAVSTGAAVLSKSDPCRSETSELSVLTQIFKTVTNQIGVRRTRMLEKVKVENSANENQGDQMQGFGSIGTSRRIRVTSICIRMSHRDEQ